MCAALIVMNKGSGSLIFLGLVYDIALIIILGIVILVLHLQFKSRQITTLANFYLMNNHLQLFSETDVQAQSAWMVTQ